MLSTSMGVNARSKPSTLQTSSGNIGCRSICQHFKSPKSGSAHDRIYLLETSFLLLVKIFHVVTDWPKGVVQEVFPDRSGNVRHVTVRTTTSVLRHDVSKLRLLKGTLELRAEGQS